jgi:hypothetical protein
LASPTAFDGPLAAFGLERRPWEQDHVPAGHDDPPHLWARRLWGKAAPGGIPDIYRVRRRHTA